MYIWFLCYNGSLFDIFRLSLSELAGPNLRPLSELMSITMAACSSLVIEAFCFLLWPCSFQKAFSFLRSVVWLWQHVARLIQEDQIVGEQCGAPEDISWAGGLAMWHIHVHTAERMWMRPPPKVIQAITSQTPSHLGCPCVQGLKWCKQLWAVLYLPEFILNQCHHDYNAPGCILESTLYLEMLEGFLSSSLVIDWLASRSWCQGSCLGWSVWSTDLLPFQIFPEEFGIDLAAYDSQTCRNLASYKKKKNLTVNKKKPGKNL